MQLEDVRVVAKNLAFPEGPVALPDGSVVLVEMNAGKLSCVHSTGTVTVVAEVGGGPNGAALGPDGAFYVCNNGGQMSGATARPSIQRVDLETGSVETLYEDCGGDRLMGPNDLVFDSVGNFWFTDFGANAIFYASIDGNSIRRSDVRAMQPNGIGLSPAGDVVYWSETFTRQVHRRRLAGPGEIVPSVGCDLMGLLSSGSVDRWALVAGLPGASAIDSLAIEEGGSICVGTLIDGGITVIDPDTGSVDFYTLPEEVGEQTITNICFGGPDLRTAFLTCAMTGQLVACRWPRQGLRLNFQDVASSKDTPLDLDGS